MSNEHADRAKHLLAHYLKFGLEAAGYRWDGDNVSEVDELVTSLIAAAKPAQPAPVVDYRPDALTRIADALTRIAASQERIATQLKDGVIYTSDADQI